MGTAEILRRTARRCARYPGFERFAADHREAPGGASRRAALIALSGSLSLAVHSGFPLDVHANVANPCVAHAKRVEVRQVLPTGLLRAIALVESGWSPAGGGVPQPWPWAVGSRGQGRFFATKSAAVDFVEALQATGEWNIDVLSAAGRW